MSKLACVCGHIIQDQTDFIPYKARFVRDQDDESHHAYIDDIAAFIAAIKANERDQWIRSYFSSSYPTDISNSDIVNDIIVKYEGEFEGTLYQCENCSRVKIQVQDKNLFTSFMPEDEDAPNVFRSFKK